MSDRVLIGCVLIGALLLTLIALDASPLLRGPSPAPAGWRWPYRQTLLQAWSWTAFGSGVGLLSLLSFTGSPRLPDRRAPLASALAAAAAFGLGLQWGLLELAREGTAVRALIGRTISPDFTSYYSVAVAPAARNVAAFVDHHAELIATAPASLVHFSTHPPGAVLYYRAVLALCQSSPMLTALAVDAAASAGFSSREGAEAILATALIAPLGLMVLAALSCLPVAALARAIGASRIAATRIGMVWLAVPGVVLIHPELDQLLMVLVATALALLAWALRTATPEASAPAVAALGGAPAGLAIFVSHGAAAFMAVGAVGVLALHGAAGTRRALRQCSLAAGVSAAVLSVPIAFGHEPIESLMIALRILRERFTLPRSHAEWVVYNLWDLAVSMGFVLAALWAARVARALRRLRGPSRPHALAPAERLLLATTPGLLALDLSGTVRGETAACGSP